MTKTTEEGPYRIEDAWSGSFKKGKVVGPSLSKEDIFPGTPETLCDMLNAAWLAGRSSATAVPLSPDMVEKIMEVVDDVCSFDNWSVPQIQRLRTRLLGIR